MAQKKHKFYYPETYSSSVYYNENYRDFIIYFNNKRSTEHSHIYSITPPEGKFTVEYLNPPKIPHPTLKDYLVDDKDLIRTRGQEYDAYYRKFEGLAFTDISTARRFINQYCYDQNKKEDRTNE